LTNGAGEGILGILITYEPERPELWIGGAILALFHALTTRWIALLVISPVAHVFPLPHTP